MVKIWKKARLVIQGYKDPDALQGELAISSPTGPRALDSLDKYCFLKQVAAALSEAVASTAAAGAAPPQEQPATHACTGQVCACGGRRGSLEALRCGADEVADVEMGIGGRRRRRRAWRLDGRRDRVNGGIAG